jgi:hypothetical protein
LLNFARLNLRRPCRTGSRPGREWIDVRRADFRRSDFRLLDMDRGDRAEEEKRRGIRNTGTLGVPPAAIIKGFIELP